MTRIPGSEGLTLILSQVLNILQPLQVMEVDSLRGVVVAGSQRPVAGGRMAKHVARLDPVRPAHMMPAIIARPIIQVAPDPPPERLAALREEHRRKQRCGGAAANLADLFDKEAAAPSPAPAAIAALPAAGKRDRKAAAAAVPPAPPFSMHAPPDRGAVRNAVSPILSGDGTADRVVGSPGGAAACSESSTEVGPTPMDDGGGRHRSRLPGLGGGAAGGDVGGGATFGLARGLFTDLEAGEAPTVKFNPGGDGVFSQVATFQIVNKPREVAQQQQQPQQQQQHVGGEVTAGLNSNLAPPAAAAAGVAPAPHPAVAAPTAVFTLGAAVAVPVIGMECMINGRPSCPASGAIPDGSDPPGLDVAADGADGAGRGVLCLPGGEADPFSELNCDGTVASGDAVDADAQVVYDADGGELACDDEQRECVPSGCRLQGESHSADSLPCRRQHGDGGDSDSDGDGDGNRKTSPGGNKRAPREPVPDACSPCGFSAAAARRTAAAAAATSRLAGGNSRIPICAPGPGLVPPRSRKAPPAAAAAAAVAAAAAAGAAPKRNSFRPAVAKPPLPRFTDADKAQRALPLAACRDTPGPQSPPALQQTIADGGVSLNLLSPTQAADERPANGPDRAQHLQPQQAEVLVDPCRLEGVQGPAAEGTMDIDGEAPTPILSSPLPQQPLQAPPDPDQVGTLAADATATAAAPADAIATLFAHASPVKAGNQDVDVTTGTCSSTDKLIKPAEVSLACGLPIEAANDLEQADAEQAGTPFATGTVLSRTPRGLTPYPGKTGVKSLLSLMVPTAAAQGEAAAAWRHVADHDAGSHDLQPTLTLLQPQQEQQQQQQEQEPENQHHQHQEATELALPVDLAPGIGLGSRARNRQAGRRRAQRLEEPPGQLWALVATEKPGLSEAKMVQDPDLAAAAAPVALVQGIGSEQHHGGSPTVVADEAAEVERTERCGDANANACEDAAVLVPADVAGDHVSVPIGQAPGVLGSPSQRPCAEDEGGGASAPAVVDAPSILAAATGSQEAEALGNPTGPSDAIMDDAALAELLAGGTMYDIVKLRGRQSQVGTARTPGDKLTPPPSQTGSKGGAPSVGGRCGSVPASATKSGVSGAGGASVTNGRDNKASKQQMAASGGTGVRAGRSQASATAMAAVAPVATTPRNNRTTTPIGARATSTVTKVSQGRPTRGGAADSAGTPRRVRADTSVSRLPPVSQQKCQPQHRLPPAQDQRRKRRAEEGSAEDDGAAASVAMAINTEVAPNSTAVMASATADDADEHPPGDSQQPLSKRRRKADVQPPHGPGLPEPGDETDRTCTVVEQTGEGVAAAGPLTAVDGADGELRREEERAAAAEEGTVADEVMGGADLQQEVKAGVQRSDEASALVASQPASADGGVGEEAVPEEEEEEQLPGSPLAHSPGHSRLNSDKRAGQQHQGQQQPLVTTSDEKDNDADGDVGCGSLGTGEGDLGTGRKAEGDGASTKPCGGGKSERPNTRSRRRQPHEDTAIAVTVAAVAAKTTASGVLAAVEHEDHPVVEQESAAAVEGGDDDPPPSQAAQVRRSGRLRQGKSTEAAPGATTRSYGRPLAQSVGGASLAAGAPLSSVSTRGAARRQALAVTAAVAGDTTPCTKRPAQRAVATRRSAEEDSEVGAQGGSRPAKRTRR
ncbi:hypothetical protein Vafri_6012 [Volvox africanus]|nr:hypothetical protein Vafri_6012 [Volvox africanus]